MVRLVDWVLLGACTLFSTTYALPQPDATPLAILERATGDKTRTVTRTSTGTRASRVRTRTNTFTKPKTTKTKSTKTKPTSKPTKPTSPSTATPTSPTKTTTSRPKPTGTPGTCGYYASTGGEYTDSKGVTYDIDCGALIVGVPFSTVSTSSYGGCLNLCSANPNCVAFHWDYPLLFVPGQCFLFDISVSLLPSLVSDAGVVVRR